MDKKKAIKLATASAVAASAFVAANPNASEAATNVASVVSQAKAQFKNAYYAYSQVTSTGKFADINTVYAEYNKAKKAYDDAVALVKKAGGANKDALLADLDATYNEYVAKRVVTYIDAYNYAVKLDALRKDLQAAVDAKDLAKAEDLYNKISYELKKRTVILDRVYGQTTRDLLRSQFKAAAQQLRDSLVYDITVSVKLKAAEEATNKGDLTAADAALKAAQDALAKATAFKTELTAKQATVKAAYEAKVTPKVESVSANNLKEITVTFNKSLDKATAETASNYTLSSGTVSSAKLDESGKVVTLTLASAAAQQASVDVTIKNVKDVDGKVVADTTKSVKFFDTAVPAAQKIEVTGPKTLRVYFSEPITSTAITTVSNFSIDNNTYSISSVTGTAGNNYVDITLGATLPEGTHKLTINAQNLTTDPAIKDFAGFFVPKAELSFEYKADKAAPVVTVDKVSQNSVTLKFNKDIDPTTQSYLTVYHTYNNVSGYQGSVSWTDNKTAVVTFASNYLPVGNATLYVNAGTGSNLAKDTWGNAFVSTSLNANVVADNEAPTVKEVKVVDSTHIDVTFSEAVSGATTASNYTLTDSTGAAVTVSSVSNTTGNTYRLTTATLNGGSYTLKIKGIKDTSVSQNAMADYTTTVNVTDLVKPTVTTTGVYSTDKKKIVISFSEAMATTGAGSVLDKANYQVALNGSAFADLSTFSGSSITLGADGKSVIIDLGSAQSGLSSGTSKVRVARVADLAGNTTADFTTDVTLSVDNVTTANISDVKAIAQNKVQFKLNTALSAIDVSKFTIKVGATDRPATAATYVNNGNTSIVTVEVADANKFATDLSNLVNVQFTAGAVTTALGTSNSGTVIQAITPATADYVAPTMGTVATGDLNGNGKIDQVTVTFSESLYVASVQESDFTVEGYEITGVSVSGGGTTVTLTVKEKSTVDTGVTPKVTLAGSVSDNTAQRNSVGNLSAVTATDGVAPVAPAATDFTIANAANSALTSKSTTLSFAEPVKVEYYVSTDANNAATPSDVPVASTPGTQATTNIGTGFVTSINASTAITGATLDGTKAIYVRLIDQAGNKSAWVKIN